MIQILGADVRTISAGDHYFIRIEATDRVSAFLFALGIEFRYVGPEEDSGRAWYQFEYSANVDETLIELVEFAATIREREPNFGQLELGL